MINLWCLLILYIVALVCCSIGFKSFVWFLSIGYGYAVSGIAVAALVFGFVTGYITPGIIVGCIVIAAYGIRLGTFLLIREKGNKAYKEILVKKTGKEPPFFVKAVAWLLVGVLYVCQTAGMHFRITNHAEDDIVLIIGIIIMVLGACTEALADKQKSAQKAKRPDMVATEGLFKLVRCPNYFGEILFWTGVLVSGITSYANAVQWIIALLGYICIVYVMVDGAKRMEKGHIARYGTKPEYNEYAEKTPILFPFIPLYHIYQEKPEKK